MMPASVYKTAADVHRRNAQHPCNFAVTMPAVEKNLGFVEVKRDWTSRLSSVHVLLVSCCPTAVVSKIPLIIIDAVKRQSFRALAHIFEKVSKVSPSLTDSDAATAIVIESMVTRIAASIDHMQPRIVNTASFPVSCVSVFGAIIKFGHDDLRQGWCVKWRSDLAGSGRCAFSVT